MMNKKGIDKKKLVLSLFVFGLMLSTIVMVSALDPDDFFKRWMEGALENSDAKILIFLLTAVVILVILMTLGLSTNRSLLISIPLGFLLTAFVTPESIIGIFKSYDSVPLTIATLLPLLLFFGLTYLSVSRTSRTLMTLQFVAWLVLLGYIVVKLILYGIISYALFDNWRTFQNVVQEMGYQFPTPGTAEASFFGIAMFFQLIIALLMTVKNGFFMNWALKMTAGIDETKAGKKANDIKTAVDFLENIKKTATGE